MTKRNGILNALTKYKNENFRGKDRMLFERHIEEIKKELDVLTLYSYQDINLTIGNYNRLLEDYKFIKGGRAKHFLFTIEYERLTSENKLNTLLNEKEILNGELSYLRNQLWKNEGFIGLYEYNGYLLILVEDENNSKKMTQTLKLIKKQNKMNITFVYERVINKFRSENKTILTTLFKNENKLKGGK